MCVCELKLLFLLLFLLRDLQSVDDVYKVEPLKHIPVLTEAWGSTLWPNEIHNTGNIAGIPVVLCGNQRLATQMSGIPSPGDK